MPQFRMLLKAGTGNREPGTSGQQFASFFFNFCKESFVLYFTSMFPSVNQGSKGGGGGVFGVLEP